MDFQDKVARAAQFDNGEQIQGAYCEAAPSVTYNTGSVSASTDPFSSKTNKYAESRLVRIYATAVGHVLFSAAGTTVDTNDWPIPAGVPQYFVVEKGMQFLRVIPTTGSATFYVSEIY